MTSGKPIEDEAALPKGHGNPSRIPADTKADGLAGPVAGFSGEGPAADMIAADNSSESKLQSDMTQSIDDVTKGPVLSQGGFAKDEASSAAADSKGIATQAAVRNTSKDQEGGAKGQTADRGSDGTEVSDGHIREDDEAWRRDQLLSTLNLLVAVGLFFTVPFALQAGAVFFLPLTAAFTLAITLVPAFEWLEKRGLPIALAALTCVTGLVLVINAAIAAILFPAINWVSLLPERLGHLRETLAPLLNVYAAVQAFVDQLMGALSQGSNLPNAPQQVMITTPNSLIDLVAISAPGALVQMLFGLLLIYFFLASWPRMRTHSLLSRASADGSVRMVRTARNMVSATANYIGTITLINMSMGAVVALVLAVLGMPMPLMWGGVAALLNYIPYLGPTVTTAFLVFGGLIAFDGLLQALVPAAVFLAIHTLEANVITPMLVGRRFTINPLFILIAISFWGWVWGTVGALLSVPLLIMTRVLLENAGKLDIAGFLFEEKVLRNVPQEDEDNRKRSLDR